MRYQLGLSCLLLISPFFCANSNAGIIISLTPDGNGGVNVLGAGAGTTTGVGSSNDWDVLNFATRYLPLQSTKNVSDLSATSVSGTFTNLTTATSAAVVSFRVDNDSSPTGDDLDWGTSSFLTFSAGDQYQINFNAHFSAADLQFSDLVLGSHFDAASSSVDEIFGITEVRVATVAVPEPSGVSLSALVGLFLFIRRASRQRK